MKQAIRKFSIVPSFRNIAAGASAAVASIGVAMADPVSEATSALATAQTGGEQVGGIVVGVVCALAVVGVIIALVRKV